MYGLSNTALACDLTAQVNEAAEKGLAVQLGLTNNLSLFEQIFAQALFCSPSTYTTDGADYNLYICRYGSPDDACQRSLCAVCGTANCE